MRISRRQKKAAEHRTTRENKRKKLRAKETRIRVARKAKATAKSAAKPA